MKMKKMSILMVCVLCLALFAACTGNSSAETTPPATDIPATDAPETAEPTPEPTDEAPATDEPTEAPEKSEADEIYDAIMEAIDTDLPQFITLGTEEIEQYYGVSGDGYIEASCHVPMMNVSATELSLFKVSEDQAEAVLAGIEKRLEDLDATWSWYLPDQYELVKNAKVVQVGDWILLAISSEADAMVEAFNSLME